MKLGLKIPPLALGLIAILFVWLLAKYIPLYHITFIHQNLVASALVATGVIIALSGVFAFRKMRTTVDPRYPDQATKLVIIGTYKYSRNPMYLGMLLAITGIAVYSGALSGLVSIISFIAFINKCQIGPEEVMLLEKFGEDYIHYTQSVRRWI